MLEGTVMCRCKHHWKKGGKEGRTTFSSISFRAALKSMKGLGNIAMCDTMRTAFLHISGFERGKKGGEESSPPSSGQERCNAGMKNRFMRRHRTRIAQSRCLGKCHDARRHGRRHPRRRHRVADAVCKHGADRLYAAERCNMWSASMWTRSPKGPPRVS